MTDTALPSFGFNETCEIWIHSLDCVIDLRQAHLLVFGFCHRIIDDDNIVLGRLCLLFLGEQIFVKYWCWRTRWFENFLFFDLGAGPVARSSSFDRSLLRLFWFAFGVLSLLSICFLRVWRRMLSRSANFSFLRYLRSIRVHFLGFGSRSVFCSFLQHFLLRSFRHHTILRWSTRSGPLRDSRELRRLVLSSRRHVFFD